MAANYGQIYGAYIAGNNFYGHGGFANPSQAMQLQMAGGPAGCPTPRQGPQVNSPFMFTNSGPLLLGHHVNCSQAGVSIAGSRCPLCGGLDPRDMALYGRLSGDYSAVNAPLGYVGGAVAGLQWASPRVPDGWPGGGGRVNGAVAPVGSMGTSPTGALAEAHFFFR